MTGSDLSPDALGSPVRLPLGVRWLLVIVGLGFAIAGVVAIFDDHDGAASAALITIGIALAALALLAPYFRRFKAGGIEVELLQQQVVDTQSALRDLVTGIAEPLGKAYELIREHVPPGPDRTDLLHSYFEVIARQGQYGQFSQAEVADLFRTRGEGGRIVALALMSHDPSLAAVDCVVDGIAASESAFEQRCALIVAERAAAEMAVSDRHVIRDAVDRGRHHYIDPSDESRLTVEKRLLKVFAT